MERRTLHSQTDIFAGPTRPRCTNTDAPAPADKSHPGIGSCGAGPDCLINIGLTYFRRSLIKDDGPMLGLLRDINSKFVSMLDGEPMKDDAGNAVSQALLDQPMFRQMLDRRVGPSGGWRVASGAHANVYGGHKVLEGNNGNVGDLETEGDGCPHSSATCRAIGAQRAKTAFSYAALKEQGADGVEFVAGAPDWLYGRGCVKTVLSAPAALKHLAELSGGDDGGHETCDAPADTPGVANHAPGGFGVGSGLVAIHMVYSKAHKRQEAMEVMGWWRSTPMQSQEKKSTTRRLLKTEGAADNIPTRAVAAAPPWPRRGLHAIATKMARGGVDLASDTGAGAGAGAEDTAAAHNTCPVPEPPASEPETSPVRTYVFHPPLTFAHSGASSTSRYNLSSRAHSSSVRRIKRHSRQSYY